MALDCTQVYSVLERLIQNSNEAVSELRNFYLEALHKHQDTQFVSTNSRTTAKKCSFQKNT